MATHDEVRAIKSKYSQELLRKPGVCGVGIEKSDAGDYVLVVHLDDPSAQKELPAQLDGHPVRYVVSGPFRKLPSEGGAADR